MKSLILSIPIIIVFIFSVVQNSYSQQTISVDTVAMDSFNNIIDKAYNSHNDSIIADAEYFYACYLLLDMGYKEMSIPYFDRAIERYKKINNNYRLAKCYYFKNGAYYEKGLGNNNKAIENMLIALKYAELSGDSLLINSIYTNLAILQIVEHRDSTGMVSIRKAIDFAKAIHDTNNLIVLYSNLGNSFYISKQYDSVFYYYGVSQEYARSSIRFTPKLATNYGNTALTYLEINNVSKALENARRADSVFAIMKSDLGKSWVYHIYSKAYFQQGDYDKAIAFSNMSLALGEKINSPNTQMEAYQMNYMAYKKRKDYKNALLTMEKYKEIFDSLNNEKRYNETEKLLSSYEFYKKEQQVKLLKATDKIKTQTIKAQAARIRFIIIIGLLFLIALAIFVYFWYMKYKSSMEILKKNLELEKHEENENCAIVPDKNLVDEKDKQIIEEWHNKILKQKVFKRADCSVDMCADILNTNRSYLSKALNNYFKKSFTTLINEYRIREAKSIFKQDESKKYTIEAIAEQSGFNNKVSFTAAFKKYTGLTPGFYRDNAAKLLKSEFEERIAG